MKWHRLMFVVILGASASAWAHKPAATNAPLQTFEPLIGHWQCQAQQMRIGLDRFDLEYIDAHVALHVVPQEGSHNLNASMHAVSVAQEPLFETSGLITYDPQRSLFVQYETTQGGSDATLYTPGFAGPCVTWRYAPDIESLKSASAADIGIEATWCVAEAGQSLHIDYTLHLAEHDPFVLFTASCDRSPEAH